jgi:hypothetical protein
MTPTATLSVQGSGGGGQIIDFAQSTGVSAFHIASNGNVGVGTTTPWADFSIAGSPGGTNSLFTISTSTSGFATSTAFQIDNNGHVAIGQAVNATPETLDVLGSFAVETAIGVDNFIVTAGGHVGIGTSTPQWALNIVDPLMAQLTLGDGTIANPWSFRSVGGNLYIATSSSSGTFGTSTIPALSIVSSAGSISGIIGIGSSTPWGKLSVEMGTLNPAFVISNQGSTSPAFIVSGVNQNGGVGIGTSSPLGIFSIATTSFSNIPGTGTALTIQSTAGTTTIGFFVGTTTGLTAGVGMALPSMPNMIIVGNGKVKANMAIVNGGLCVDSDGWCTASSTVPGRVSSKQFITSGADVAELYTSDMVLEAGDIVATDGRIAIKAAEGDTKHQIIGIVSTAPGLTLGLGPDDSGQGAYPVALAGRVPVKISLQNGPIAVGDHITLSSVPGIGMKADPFDPTVGIALESYTATSTGNSIMVFMNLDSGADVQMLAQKIASSTATSTASSILSGFADASIALTNALSGALSAITDIAQSGVRELGIAVHASLGIFDKIFAKEVHTDNLCVGTVCVTQDQFLKMIQSSGTAAAAPAAPPPPSAPVAPPPPDTTASTTANVPPVASPPTDTSSSTPPAPPPTDTTPAPPAPSAVATSTGAGA